jgi:hypothetical protein
MTHTSSQTADFGGQQCFYRERDSNSIYIRCTISETVYHGVMVVATVKQSVATKNRLW